MDYRGYGKSSGTITSEKAILLDAVAAYDFLQQQVAEKDIVVYGRSVGSAPATYLATVRHPRTLILEAPFYSLQDMVAQQLPFPLPSPLLKYTFRNDLGRPMCNARSIFSTAHAMKSSPSPRESVLLHDFPATAV